MQHALRVNRQALACIDKALSSSEYLLSVQIQWVQAKILAPRISMLLNHARNAITVKSYASDTALYLQQPIAMSDKYIYDVGAELALLSNAREPAIAAMHATEVYSSDARCCKQQGRRNEGSDTTGARFENPQQARHLNILLNAPQGGCKHCLDQLGSQTTCCRQTDMSKVFLV